MDFLYKKLSSKLSHLNKKDKDSLMQKAGYFKTSKNINTIPALNPRFVCTPFENVLNKYKKNSVKKQIVLLCTGSFAPMHDGHISMIQHAIKALEVDYDILGVYISPGHDEYVLTKNNTHIFNAEDRIQLAMDKIKEHNLDWSVDPWEALYTGCALNFTEVLLRLKKYLSFHIASDIDIAFCFGADNSNFTYVLEDIPHVCVSRNNIRKFDMTNKGIFVCHNYENISSTQIREQIKTIKKNGKIALRGDGRLYDILKSYFPYDIYLWNDLAVCDNQIINLDALSNDIFKYNLEISRSFILADNQNTSKYINRPGSENLKTQIENIPTGNYILFDDDIHTGGTMNYIKSLLPDRIKIQKIQTLIQKQENTIDILDERDFLMNHCYGGLVVQARNKSWRVPYIMPFVNIRRRANLDNGKGREFSLKIIAYNKRLLTNEKAFDYMNGFFYNVCKFNKNMLIVDILSFYEECLLFGLL